jgi:hypothetical protein
MRMVEDNLTEQARGLRRDIAGLAGSVAALAGRTAQSERTVTRMRRITIALVLSLVLIAVVGVYVVRLAVCQAAVNEANNQRTRALTEVTADERAAERNAIDLLFALLRNPSVTKPADERTAADRARVAALVVELRAAGERLEVERAEADTARRAHPVPPPPSVVCGGLI